MRARRVQVGLTSLVLLAAVVVAIVRAGHEPLRMNDYEGFGSGQSVWHVGDQMYFVVPVPVFNQPVRIRSVELRTVFGAKGYDASRAFLLQFFDQDFYGGPKVTTDAGLDAYTRPALHTPLREPLGALRVQKLDNRLSIVIPLNSHDPGCHEAQVVLHVTTSGGGSYTLATRWYVGLDTGISRISGDDMCAGPR